MPVSLHGLPLFWIDFLKIAFSTVVMIVSLTLVDPLLAADNLIVQLSLQTLFSFCVYALSIMILYYKQAQSLLKSLNQSDIRMVS